MVRRAPPHCGHGSSSGTWSRFCLQSVQTICMRGQQHVFALERVDLAEDWFDDRLAPGVGTLASFGAELAGHPLLGREVLRDPTCWCRPFLLELNNPPAQSGELLPRSGGQRPTGPWPRSILACFT